jgi:DNA (cytosine-5)-methyltransferase 1
MDTTEITHLSLCSGYGGLDLGIKGVFGENCRTVAYAEIEAFAVECLLARMEGGQLDAAPIWPNLKSFPWEAFSDRVDILSGGYPCQPFSAAGKRLGTEDPRHLWPFIANGIRIMQPKLCFFENVEGHISLGLREVVGELESMGYKVSWGIFSAREVGAPHQRKRVFILAHLRDAGLQRHWGLEQIGLERGRTLEGGHASSTSEFGIQTVVNKEWPTRPGEPQHGWEPPRQVIPNAQPSLGGDFDGTASGLDYAKLCISNDNRTDELRLLGNGVVPATATKALLTLLGDLFK